jgi:Uma2 family endonuclease
MSALPKLSPEAYLVQERLNDTKSEYIAGDIFAMSGGSPAHNLIGGNIIGTLHAQLKQRPCRVYTSDQRVQVNDGYVYPDLSIVCGEPVFANKDNLQNPTVLVEVLSPSTADYDAGGKFTRYRHIDSLQEYLMVAQDACQLILCTRQADRSWLLREYTELTAKVELNSIACQLAITDVYDKVFD